MKKISQVIMIVLGMMVVLTGKVWAQDGSLKINVDVPVQTNVNEQTYFEQDITLKQLFDASLSQMISALCQIVLMKKFRKGLSN